MASNLVWYAGPCVKQHDKGVQLEATAQLVGHEWVKIDNREALFRGNSTVELRGNNLRSLKASDWVAFQVSGMDRSNKIWIAGEHRRLFRYSDQSELGGTEQLRRALLGTGISAAKASGTWMVRSSQRDVLQIELRQVHGLAQIAGVGAKVPAFEFAVDSVIQIPAGMGIVELYDQRHDAVPTDILDWSSDEAFALRISQAISDAANPGVREIITWLEDHAREGRDLLPLNVADLATANEALRSGKLAKRLADDQKLLQTFVDALIGDERVAGMLRECVERIGEQERGRARVKADADIQRDMDRVRRSLRATMDAEMAVELASRSAQIDAGQSQRLMELNTVLALKKSKGEAEVERSLGAKKSALEALIVDLSGRCDALRAEFLRLNDTTNSVETRVQTLRAEESEAREGLDQTRILFASAESELAVIKARQIASRQRNPVPLQAHGRGTVRGPEAAGSLIKESALLSDSGKILVAQFLAMNMAGEVPVLCGPGVADFLLIVELLFANGTSARLEADPTIVTFEDLWLRPGSELQTPLGQALDAARGVDCEPRTTLAVVERAERSGARFWYPALQDRALRGDLPRRFLVCVTVEDADCDESVAVLARGVRLDIRNVLAPSAPLEAAMEFAEGSFGEFDPGVASRNLTKVAGLVAAHAPRIGLARSRRALRAMAEGARLGTVLKPSSLMSLFISPEETSPDSGETSSRSTTYA
jgi:hypothetical protein